MKHFIGGAALGFVVAIRCIEPKKKACDMDGFEFGVFLLAHVFFSFIFGAMAWGLLP